MPEKSREYWFQKAVEVFPHYFEWPLWMRMEHREEVDEAAGFSLSALVQKKIT